MKVLEKHLQENKMGKNRNLEEDLEEVRLFYQMVKDSNENNSQLQVEADTVQAISKKIYYKENL